MASRSKIKQIISRLTGFSLPIFGVQWQPSPNSRDVGRRVLAFLEDRRVLFAGFAVEVPDHCVQSVLEIRKYLTSEIQQLVEEDDLTQTLVAMRAACRRFLDRMESARISEDSRSRPAGEWLMHDAIAAFRFGEALGELRSVFGVHVARICVAFDLGVTADLEEMLPAIPAASDDPGLGRANRRLPKRGA